ncbi:MAG: acyl-CoA dehydrogenase family protein [Chloroflexi bacterium]|nr:acyl-CoA dehydrogenase family protein [Chloroflexota bacterium]
MDFEFRDTPKLAKFRKEVRAWLDLHIPMDFEIPDNPHDILPGSTKYEFIRTARHKLGAKGWLAPTWPKKYGGGGLSVEEAYVIESEVAQRPWSHFGIGDYYTGFFDIFGPMLYALGTEEQKKRFLPPFLRGEVIGWTGESEPDCGSDLAAVKTTAIRDGDDYVVNGSKIWLGSQYDNADYIFLVAVTDPKAPRHRNIGLFLVPIGLPGISKVHVPWMRSMHTGAWQVFFENVRMPVEYLIGGHENAANGWRVVSSATRLPQIRFGFLIRDRNQEFVLAYCQETKRDGLPLSQDSDVREALAEVEIQLEIRRLFAIRQNWQAMTGSRLAGYEAAQSGVHGKVTAIKQAEAYSDILGPAALIKEPEWALFEGNLEYQHFAPVAHASAGTTQEISKMLMSRWVCRAGD